MLDHRAIRRTLNRSGPSGLGGSGDLIACASMGEARTMIEGIATAQELEALLPELREIRHDLHQHPELGFEEHRTGRRVRQWLEARGYAPHACAQTGLWADLHPGREGRCIALRADLDCLPMQETTDLPYRSVHDGRAHKCGHDGHTAILMGVADLLARHREQIAGNVRLVFQPAEEGVRGGGARAA